MSSPGLGRPTPVCVMGGGFEYVCNSVSASGLWDLGSYGDVTFPLKPAYLFEILLFRVLW